MLALSHLLKKTMSSDAVCLPHLQIFRQGVWHFFNSGHRSLLGYCWRQDSKSWWTNSSCQGIYPLASSTTRKFLMLTITPLWSALHGLESVGTTCTGGSPVDTVSNYIVPACPSRGPSPRKISKAKKVGVFASNVFNWCLAHIDPLCQLILTMHSLHWGKEIQSLKLD